MKRRHDQGDPCAAGRAAWELLFRLFPGIRGNLLAVWDELDLTPAQGRLLQYLDPEHPVPMSELASMHACDASNITGLVDKLEARGLIERAASPSDRRVKMIAVTKAGAALRDKLLERIGQPPSFITALSESEQQTLRDLLLKATRTAQTG
jgi:DNA-binding MarR family transcriptional regulator